MTHPTYLKEKCRALRVERRLTIDELAERLALPRTTIYYWVRDLPAPPRRASPGQARGTAAMQAKYRRLREEAYARGEAEYPALVEEPAFRDFVCLYIAEGAKRNRNAVAICNSDDAVMAVAHRWLRRLTDAALVYAIQYHADQDLDAIRYHWATRLGIDPHRIALQRKSNSAQLAGRTWRSEHGVLTIRVNDTSLRARMQAWMDLLRSEWL